MVADSENGSAGVTVARGRRLRRVVLVQPNLKWMDWNFKTYWDIHPMNLCLLAAVTRGEFEVSVLDANLEDWSPERFKEELARRKPDLVGLTLLTNEYWQVVHEAARYVKEADPAIVTVLGGVYATVSYREIHKDPNFDYVCIGEGEYVFPELLRYLDGRGEFPRTGFLGRRAGEVVDPLAVKRAPFIQDLDAVPYPAWDLVDYGRYTKRVGKVTVDHPYAYPYSRLMTSRGCPIGCTFCEVEYISGGPFRHRSPENVIAEMEWLKKEYGIRSFMLDDDNFFINRARVKRILNLMIERKLDLEWKAIAVAVFHMNEEIVELMKAAGCRSVNLAIESGNPRVLKDIIKKPVDLEKTRRVCRKIKDEGMDLIANFIIGFPTETWDEIRQTFRFAEELPIDYRKFFIATPLEGTPLDEMVRENNARVGYSDTSGQMSDMNWSTSRILSDEWTVDDITILRAYEWDRINFGTLEKRRKVADMMQVSLEELDRIRRDTFRSVGKNLAANEASRRQGRPVPASLHGDHRAPGAESYPAVTIRATDGAAAGGGEPVWLDT